MSLHSYRSRNTAKASEKIWISWNLVAIRNQLSSNRNEARTPKTTSELHNLVSLQYLFFTRACAEHFLLFKDLQRRGNIKIQSMDLVAKREDQKQILKKVLLMFLGIALPKNLMLIKTKTRINDQEKARESISSPSVDSIFIKFSLRV